MPSIAAIPSRRCFKITRGFGRRSTFRRPRPRVVEIVTYGIAAAAQAAGVSLHEFGIEANRVRLVLSASERELAAFMQALDDVISEGADTERSFWRSGEPYEAVPLDDDASVLEAMASVMASGRRPA